MDPISWPSGTSADLVPVSAKNARSRLLGALAELSQRDPVLGGEPVHVGRARAGGRHDQLADAVALGHRAAGLLASA